MSENDSKWTCKKCTYDNFQKSIKCTICLTPNNVSKYIINETNDECTSTKLQIDLTNSSGDSNHKWTCNKCTYLNWPKSVKCVQCLTQRQTSQSSSQTFDSINQQLNHEESNLNDQHSNLSSSKISSPSCNSSSKSTISISSNEFNFKPNDQQQEQKDLIKLNNNLNAINNKIVNNLSTNKEPDLNLDQLSPSTKFKNVKPSTSTDKRDQSAFESNNLDNSSSINNSLNNSSQSLNNEHNSTDKIIFKNQQTGFNKWACSTCTYLNWPKSLKCILCQTMKASNSTNSTQSTELSAICSDSKQSPNTNTVNSTITNSITNAIDDNNSKRNTPSPIGATCQRNRLNSNLNNVNTIMNYNLNNCTNRRKNRDQYVDWIWLEACIGVLNADPEPVLLYLNNGGDLARQLTLVEVNFLNKQTLLGYTLVHLAIRFKRSEILEVLLENRSPIRAKRVPCQVSINYGHETRKLVNNSLKQRKDFPCYSLNDFCIFALPKDILELSPSVQECLFEDLLDKDVQNELEESSIINWSLEINVTLGSRLYALWNRSKGDCLLDSVLQATYGVFDKDNRLRKALADSLNDDAAHTLFLRFKEAEILKVSHHLPYSLDEMQWEDDWAIICSCAAQAGQSLEQFHIFVLSHILRRPILVYGVKFFKSFRGEKFQLAGFQGVYLPLHLDPKFCTKSPISLAYTKGHFTALVPMEGMASYVCDNDQLNNDHVDCPNCVVSGAGNIVKNNLDTECCYLPLVTMERELLPLQFLIKAEIGRQEEIMRQYLDCCVTEEGILVCKQKLQTKKPYPMQMMINEWLDYYRNIPIVNCSKTSSNE